ncbi:RNA polymerase sigma factor [Streptomyces sp. NPDC001381]|uniref:RNA polymerase sigma factor n=1 Tax=Streptomyces sp. NPDC001381 TaxID=3364567 RepID=UPI003691A99C
MTERSCDGEPSEKESHAAFTGLFNAYYRQAVTFVHMEDPSVDVEEIVEEAFVEILTRWASIENPPAYLFTVLRNGIRKHRRNRSREEHLREQLRATRPRETTADPLEGKIIYDDVIAALQELPAAVREVAVMSWMLHKPADQVAEELGKSRSTVTTQLTYAARRLRTFLTAQEEER